MAFCVFFVRRNCSARACNSYCIATNRPRENRPAETTKRNGFKTQGGQRRIVLDQLNGPARPKDGGVRVEHIASRPRLNGRTVAKPQFGEDSMPRTKLIWLFAATMLVAFGVASAAQAEPVTNVKGSRSNTSEKTQTTQPGGGGPANATTVKSSHSNSTSERQGQPGGTQSGGASATTGKGGTGLNPNNFR